MKLNQSVIIEERDFTGQVVGTKLGIFLGYDDSDVKIKLENGKITYEKMNQVFESIEKYNQIVSKRNKNQFVEKEISAYDEYEY